MYRRKVPAVSRRDYPANLRLRGCAKNQLTVERRIISRRRCEPVTFTLTKYEFAIVDRPVAQIVGQFALHEKRDARNEHLERRSRVSRYGMHEPDLLDTNRLVMMDLRLPGTLWWQGV